MKKVSFACTKTQKKKKTFLNANMEINFNNKIKFAWCVIRDTDFYGLKGDSISMR